eukprot:g1924.t1
MTERERSRSRRRERTRKSKWGDAAAEEDVQPPDWVQELYAAPPQIAAPNPAQLRANLTGPKADGGGGSHGPSRGGREPKPEHVSKEMEIPSAVMGHVIGPKGTTISQFRTSTGVHVQVISNPSMPFGRLQIGPGLVEAVDKCVQLVNEKLLDYVARGQAQLQATGMQPNIPPTMLDEQMNYVPIVAKEIDAAAQLAELQDLGPAYPGGIVKELTIPANLMGGIIGPRQSTLAQIRKAAKVRIEIASQPKVGVVSEGVLRVGPAPPEIIAKCEELIQIKSEELLGQRPRSNPMTFGAIAETLSNGGQMPGGGGKGGPPPGFPTARGPNYGHGKGQAPTGQEECPPGMEFQEVEVPKELMGAMIGTQGSGIERLKSSFAAAGFQMGVSISQNPARDATVDVGKLRLGPGVPEQVMEASRIVAARVEECRQMRDASKGIGKPDGGKFDGGKGKGYGKFKGSDKGKGAAPGPYSGYGNPQMNPHMIKGRINPFSWALA